MKHPFVRSFFLPWQAIGMVLSNGKLFFYSLIPFVFNLIIFSGLIAFYVWWGIHLAQKFTTTFGDTWWAAVLGWLAGILIFLGLTAIQTLLFTQIAMLLSGVFGEQLSYQTEYHLRGSAQPSPEGNMLAIAIRSAIEELKGIAFFALVFLVLFLLSLIIPVVGSVIFAVVTPILSAFSLSFEFMAPTTERRGMRFREKRQFIFNHPAAALGFGLGVLPMSLIPILNFTFIPFAIVGGTRWFLINEDLEEKS